MVVVRSTPHQNRWIVTFAGVANRNRAEELRGTVLRAEPERLRSALGDVAVRIEHVGSTSVPGLAAKPNIDIQVSVPDVYDRDPYFGPLFSLGYEHVPDPEFPDYPFFGWPSARVPRTF